jgi:hypothetical protein
MISSTVSGKSRRFMTGSLPQSPPDRLKMKVAVLREANCSEIVDVPMLRTLFMASTMTLPVATPDGCQDTSMFEGVNEGLPQNTRASNRLVHQKAVKSTAEPGLL